MQGLSGRSHRAQRLHSFTDHYSLRPRVGVFVRYCPTAPLHQPANALDPLNPCRSTLNINTGYMNNTRVYGKHFSFSCCTVMERIMEDLKPTLPPTTSIAQKASPFYCRAQVSNPRGSIRPIRSLSSKKGGSNH